MATTKTRLWVSRISFKAPKSLEINYQIYNQKHCDPKEKTFSCYQPRDIKKKTPASLLHNSPIVWKSTRWLNLRTFQMMPLTREAINNFKIYIGLIHRPILVIPVIWWRRLQIRWIFKRFVYLPVSILKKKMLNLEVLFLNSWHKHWEMRELTSHQILKQEHLNLIHHLWKLKSYKFK